MSLDPQASVAIPVRLGDFEATIEAPPDLAEEIRAALVDVLLDHPADDAVRVEVSVQDEGVRVTSDGRTWRPGFFKSPVDQLMHVLLRSTLDRETDRLHLHAGLVSIDGAGVLIAGYPGSGKSTFVTALVEAGYNYHTDESVGVDRGGRLTPFPKPISLLNGSHSAFARFDPRQTGLGAATDSVWYLPASAIRKSPAPRAPAPSLLVILRYEQNSPLEVEDLHPAHATRLLLSDSADSERIGADGLHIAAQLCARVRCVTMRYGELQPAVATIGTLVRDQGKRSSDVAPLRFNAAVSRDTGDLRGFVEPVRGLSGCVVDGRCLLRQPGDGSIVELDEASSAWFQLFDGFTSTVDIIHDVAFAEQLSVAEVEPLATRMIDALTAARVSRIAR